MDNLVFDSLKLIQIPVKLEGKWYVLCEGSEAAVKEYQAAGMAGIELDMSNIDVNSQESIKESLKKSIKKFDPSKATSGDTQFLARCLKNCEVKTHNNDIDNVTIVSVGESAFTKEQIDAWSPRVVNPLLAKLKEITELDKAPQSNPFQAAGQKSTIPSTK
jgi:hypothetical protein